ncbi:phosphoglucomutase/phosphomannomutase alpha/beta/alpha domain I [Thermaerobacter marianensis DSM 12885]|uniref:Phosphoglucomutase n=1 Tax=Thermaerobacter marianensis (strain ATCC 700841 / DSM 12885 / JCM 10246 / 7p75a) TaxID=644966 RepID=E6SLQ4_THEM7|nr:phosphoglucomutase/phosphomannomutase family protein [Thermaerobacter marianensis]ADU50321.1 phosphoglucomutase/phosphomannomutase alpha/beta/alpha domain I [Thermaerobacter marianensis DSM 12885]
MSDAPKIPHEAQQTAHPHHPPRTEPARDRATGEGTPAGTGDAGPAPIRFGTDGWRAVIAEAFTFANVRRVAWALAEHLQATGRASQGVAVGYDCRFLSDRFAATVASVLAAAGIPVVLSRTACPTPALSWAVVSRKLGAGVMITASHNPPEYNGFKLKGWFGGPALPDETRQLEAVLARQDATRPPGQEPPRGMDLDEARRRGRIEEADLIAPYTEQLRRLVDWDRLRAARLRLVVDPMHGAARGVLAQMLREAGAEVTEIRGDWNPGFGGLAPEPIAPNLGPAVEAVKSLGAQAVLVTDGDGDRVGAVDATGEVLDAQRIFALLLQHLVEVRGWTGSVVKTFAGTRMVDKLAARYGLPFRETPIGFKHVCEYALKEDVLIGGEESGGIGIKNHMPERDGLLCNLLLAEIMATRGCTLGQQVATLMAEIGPHYFQRRDLHLTPDGKNRLLRHLEEDPPARLAGWTVEKVDPLDGCKLIFGPSRWILFRASGTEPVVRVYAEAESPAEVETLLADGLRLVESVTGGTGR